MSITHRLGKFKIERRDIEDHPDAVQELIGRCIIIRAELLWCSDSVEYLAMSKMFDKVPKGEEPPWYNVDYRNSFPWHQFEFRRVGKPRPVPEFTTKPEMAEFRSTLDKLFEKFKADMQEPDYIFEWEDPRGIKDYNKLWELYLY